MFCLDGTNGPILPSVSSGIFHSTLRLGNRVTALVKFELLEVFFTFLGILGNGLLRFQQ